MGIIPFSYIFILPEGRQIQMDIQLDSHHLNIIGNCPFKYNRQLSGCPSRMGRAGLSSMPPLPAVRYNPHPLSSGNEPG